MAVSRKPAAKPAAPAAPAARSEADKLAACFSQAMRLTAALKRCKLSDLSDDVFMIAAELKTLEKAARSTEK